MKIQFPYRCDICGTLKGPSNHWWLRGINTEFFLVIRWDETVANEKDLTDAPRSRTGSRSGKAARANCWCG